jgi:hypothetical protein
MQRQNIPYQAAPAASALHFYAFQPQGIEVTGQLAVSIKMPMLYGSYSYLPPDGTYMLLVGFNSDSKQIVPIGVGKLTDRVLSGVTQLRITHLDYIGFAMKDETAQAVMQRYVEEAINFEQMMTELNALVR